MPYFYLVSSVFLLSATSVFGAYYDRKCALNKGATPFFNLVRILSSFLCWLIIFAFDFSFDAKVLLYSLAFGACFTMATVGLMYAIKFGSVAITTLILQSSLIGVTVWGLMFWGASFTITVGVGLALVIIAIALCVISGKSDGETEDDKKKSGVKWLIASLIMFVGNAGCSIIQREQQIAFNGKHGSMLMVFALIISSVVCVILFVKSDRTETKTLLKKGWYFPVAAGVANGILNFFVILLATSTLSPSLIYPVLAVGGLCVTMLFSLFAFKEKLKWWQWLGFALGTVAIALLNL